MFKREIYKLWSIWVISFILIIIIVAMLGIFLDHAIVSNALFGIGVVSLLPIVYNYFSRKGESIRTKRKGLKFESKENVSKYLGTSSKNEIADSLKIKIIRSRMIMAFAAVVFILCISAATLFAFI